MTDFSGRGNSPAIIIRRYEILDTKTGKSFTVNSRILYEAFLSKDSGRYMKAD